MSKGIIRVAVCPLFLSHSDREIVCRSNIAGAEKVTMIYTTKNDLETQLNYFCGEQYKNCEHYLSYKHFLWEDE